MGNINKAPSNQGTDHFLYVLLNVFCDRVGYSAKAVYRKIEDGVWREGREYVRGPDGRILIYLPGFNAWAARSTPAA